MTDITEKQTIEYFINGIKKAKSAARELAKLNSTKSWTAIRSQLSILEKNANLLYTGKAQSRTQTLQLANSIQSEKDSEKPVSTLH